MTREMLEQDTSWNISEYTNVDYYIRQGCFQAGQIAYQYDKETDELTTLKIVHAVARSMDIESYDALIQLDGILLDIENTCKADCSCECITDDDCYLLWFQYVEED